MDYKKHHVYSLENVKILKLGLSSNKSIWGFAPKQDGSNISYRLVFQYNSKNYEKIKRYFDQTPIIIKGKFLFLENKNEMCKTGPSFSYGEYVNMNFN